MFKRLLTILALCGLSLLPLRADPLPPRPVVQPRLMSAMPRAAAGHVAPDIASGAAKRLRDLDARLNMRLTLVLTSPHQNELAALAAAVTDRHSPQYRHFLTFAQWKARFAPSDDDVAQVEAWAKGAGLAETHRFATNHALVYDGSVDTIQRAFQTKLGQYSLNGRTYFANDTAPLVPVSVSPHIADVLGLTSLEMMEQGAPAGRVAPAADTSLPHVPGQPYERRMDAGADAPANPSHVRPRLPPAIRKELSGPQAAPTLEPNDLMASQAYNFLGLQTFSHCCNPNNAAGGSPPETSIAIIGQDSPQLGDLTTFFTTYGMASNLTLISLDGPYCCNLEVTLDTEWATAMSNSFNSRNDTAHVYVYSYGHDTTFGNMLDAWEQALSDDKVRVVSTSYGSAEDEFGGVFVKSISDFTPVTGAMAVQGWTVVAASDDRGGYAHCGEHVLSVQYPSSDPNVVAVGGTTLSMSESPGLTYGGEATWSGNGCLAGGSNNGGGGGGGCSGTFNQPPWQAATNACTNHRSIPDLSLNAGAGQVIYYLGQWSGLGNCTKTPAPPGCFAGGVGGTSIAAPEMAGFFAQVNSYLLSIGRAGSVCGPNANAPCGPLGPAGPALYKVATQAARNPYYDVYNPNELRNNLCSGGGYGVGYCSAPGYDMATGWGSANMLQLAWALNDYVDGFSAPRPAIVFSGPTVFGTWYTTDQVISFTIAGGGGGIAGYTAAWDADPGDPVRSGPRAAADTGYDPFYDGPLVVGGTSGALHLAAASATPGCHTAYVRAWDNDGQVSTTAGYGPFCYGQLANCQLTTACAISEGGPATYTIACPTTAAFFEVGPDGVQHFLSDGLSVSGETSNYADSIYACEPGTSSCNTFSIYAPISQGCNPVSPPHWPIGDPKKCCEACEQAGGSCNPGLHGGCTCY